MQSTEKYREMLFCVLRYFFVPKKRTFPNLIYRFERVTRFKKEYFFGSDKKQQK